MMIHRHLTNKHSHVHEIHNNIELCNYTLIIIDYYSIKGLFK